MHEITEPVSCLLCTSTPQASSGGRTLTPREMEEISTNLREMIAYEKSTVVKAHILKVQDLLVAVAVPMDI